MVPTNERLNNLVKQLTRTDEQTINSVINRVANVMRADDRLKIAETWVSGSVGKGTNIIGQSDIDLIFLLSPNQKISSEEDLFKTVREILANSKISSTIPITPYKATKITVSTIEVDVLLTKIGVKGKIGEPQSSKKHDIKIIGEGTLFTNTARILKYWKVIRDNVPKKGYISSFEIEIILSFIFKKYKPKKYLDAILSFFNYIVESELNDQLAFPSSGNALLHKSFEFKGKTFFISQARHAQKMLNRTPPNLDFLNKNK